MQVSFGERNGQKKEEVHFYSLQRPSTKWYTSKQFSVRLAFVIVKLPRTPNKHIIAHSLLLREGILGAL